VGNARRIFLIIIVLILAVWAIVVFALWGTLFFYLILAVAFLAALYLLFSKPSKKNDPPNNPTDPGNITRTK
jgi:membrane protein implicated in regulation of membrane protease activity